MYKEASYQIHLELSTESAKHTFKSTDVSKVTKRIVHIYAHLPCGYSVQHDERIF